MLKILKDVLRPVYNLLTSREVDISALYSEAPPLNQKIPNIVYQTWKKPALSLRHAREIERFRKINLDYSFRFYDDSQMAEYMELHYAGHPILSIFKDILIPASKADVWKYCILLKEGGIYCDIDSAITTPFRELLADNPSELISFEGNKWSDRLDLRSCGDPAIFLSKPPKSAELGLEFPEKLVLNWLLCFEKGNPILSEVISLIVRHASFFRGKDFSPPIIPIMHFTGPIALTQAVWMYMQKAEEPPTQLGVDFRGQGVFKLPGERNRFSVSQHYSTMPHRPIIR